VFSILFNRAASRPRASYDNGERAGTGATSNVAKRAIEAPDEFPDSSAFVKGPPSIRQRSTRVAESVSVEFRRNARSPPVDSANLARAGAQVIGNPRKRIHIRFYFTVSFMRKT